MTQSIQGVQFTAKTQAELVNVGEIPAHIAADEVAGPTAYSLISAGTEITGTYLGHYKDLQYPVEPGYASVFRVEQVGKQVEGFQPGDLALSLGHHRSYQVSKAQDAVKVPEGIEPAWAPFARLMGVTMTTLHTTTARPPETVAVMGLGPVGHLGAQIFQACGYDVIGVDPEPSQREAATAMGIERVYDSAPVDDPALARKVALVLECSGHEQAAIDGARLARPKGEVVLTGCPWTRRTDRHAHELLWEIFHHYVVVRSGWEWELPREPAPFQPANHHWDYAKAMDWLRDGRVKADGLYTLHQPSEAQDVYQAILQRQTERLCQVFDWQAMGFGD